MKKPVLSFCVVLLGWLILTGCSQVVKQRAGKLRPLADTIGFAQHAWQMDSIMNRIDRMLVHNPERAKMGYTGTPKAIVSPHDDYAYAGPLYPAALSSIRAKTVILFGVAHKARLLQLENQVIFDDYDYWKGPYGPVKVSDMREKIIQNMPANLFQVNDSMQRMEHSVEAIIPFLQYHNRNVEIISILVPYMPFDHMEEIAESLADAIKKATSEQGLVWGTDFAFVISTDAVHYGDEDWGGSNFAFYGTDSAGYSKALAREYEIMDTLAGELNPEKVKAFCSITVDKNDYKKYTWTWCGRYSVPLGLLTAFKLNQSTGNNPLTGTKIGYSNSLDPLTIPVHDLEMGTTAPANRRHWVGYAALGYE